MLLPSAFYVLLRYTAVTKVTTLVKQNYSQKYHRISIVSSFLTTLFNVLSGMKTFFTFAIALRS